MENFLKRTMGICVIAVLSTPVVQAGEVTDYANTQRICTCFEKTGTANCGTLNASNTEEANNRSAASSADNGNTHR